MNSIDSLGYLGKVACFLNVSILKKSGWSKAVTHMARMLYKVKITEFYSFSAVCPAA
jgi:hypothetical protein